MYTRRKKKLASNFTILLNENEKKFNKKKNKLYEKNPTKIIFQNFSNFINYCIVKETKKKRFK